MAKKECTKYCSIGGQALIEGIMMKSPEYVAVAVRKPDKSIQVTTEAYTPLTKKKKWYGWPIIRGLVSFVESMKTGMKTMTYAADALGEIEEEPSKFEKWLSKKLGKGIEDIVMSVAMVLGILLAVGLFVALPSFLGKLIATWTGATSALVINLIEGVIRVAVLIGYMGLIGLMKDVKRMFMYHGAEHKTIATYEKGEALTVENVKKSSRLHPRCGTNYLFLVAMISILFYALVGFTGHWAVKTLLKIALLPVVAGVSYEVLKAAAKSDNLLCRIVRWPGMMLQKITTKDPDEGQIEIAITAFELCLKPAEYLAAHPELTVKLEKKKGEKGKKGEKAEKQAAPQTAPQTNECEKSADGAVDAAVAESAKDAESAEGAA